MLMYSKNKIVEEIKMSIPKVIHYCWFGGNPKPKLVEKCIKSWKKHCPDYEIIEWNESNFDVNCCDYVREAYEAKKWAFVSDYARLKIVYDNGGIYLDTDVELIGSLEKFLKYDGYFGFEDSMHIATGLGFGSVKNNTVLEVMMNDYLNIRFLQPDGTYNQTPCPQTNTLSLEKIGLKCDNTFQIIGNNAFLPSDFFNPIDYQTMKKKLTKNTVSIHWFNASWYTKEQRAEREYSIKRVRYYKRKNIINRIIYSPILLAKKIFGDELYEKIKSKIKG